MQTFTRQTCNKQWPTVMVPRYPPTTLVERTSPIGHLGGIGGQHGR